MWDPYAEFESETLPNGLTVHAAHWPGRPWEAMGFVVHSGAEHDPVGLEGLAHFVEHQVSENIVIPKNKIRAFFNDNGGTVSLGSTGYPYTKYKFFLTIDRPIFAEALSIFGHMLLSAKLEKFIERERKVIIQEFHQRYPLQFGIDKDFHRRKALYAGCWLERFIRPLGTPESVGRITQDELQSHYDAHYTPANISIVGVGGIASSDFMELISKSPFAVMKSGTRTPLPVPITDILPPPETHYIIEASKYFATKEQIKMGAYESVTRIPGNINTQAIRILCRMLNSVLGKEIRENRAWTYSISASYRNFRNLYELSIFCNTHNPEILDEMEKSIEDCISSMEKRESLFEQTKKQALAGSLMIDPTAKDICEGAVNDLVHKQRITTYEEYRGELRQVTMNDIRNILKWLKPEQRWTCITRP